MLNEAGELAQKDGEVKWTFCGIKDDFRTEVVTSVINDFFPDDEVYLCISSGNSSLVKKSDTVEEIKKMLHKKEIGVMDKALTKMMFLNSYGTFQSGVIREFPENRPKPIGAPLKVSLHANILDKTTEKVPKAIRKHFEVIEQALNKDYGGCMEHLWISLDLVERCKSFPFRFQKRVSNSSSYTEFYTYNVGDYGVRPVFEKLRSLEGEEEICTYVFALFYNSMQVLVDKQKKLDGFNATQFRLDFLNACEKLGYSVA